MATTTNFGWTTPNDTDLVKDGAAAIRTALNGVDTSFLDLKGGTTGQVLAKASATDLDFVWSADAAGMTNPMTTTGDTIYSSSGSTPARRAIGTTGQVLTVSGGIPTWATPSTSANFSLLNSGGTSLSGTTTTVSGISGMNKLFISIENASTGSTNSALRVQFNTDTGSNYIRNSTQIEITGTYDSTYYQPAVSRSTTSIIVAQMDNDATSTMSAQMQVDGCNATGFKPYQYTGGGKIISVTANTGPVWYFGGGVYAGTSAISSVSIVSDGTFDAGTVYIYGSA